MTGPTDRPDGGSINEATRHAVEADRSRVIAAERAARRRRGSIAGRLERIWRWLRNRQSGPVPRARRVTGVLLRTVRNRGPWRELPNALATALLAPVRPAGTVPPPKPPRDWTAERAAASERLAAFASRALRARPRVAVIADAPAIDAYRADWDVVAIRPEDWFTVLTSDPPDLLVVDSARAGNGGAWTYRVAWTAHPDFFLLRDLRALVGWCAGRDIPAILRVREDVSRAPDWADAAALMDLVLVADAAAWDVFDGLRDRRGRIGRITALGAEGPAIVAAVRAGP